MSLRRIWRKMTYRTEDTTDYRAIQDHAGQHMSWWDQRGVPGTIAGEVSQPEVGYANDHVKAADPTWKGPR